jgi:hypothetical protein
VTGGGRTGPATGHAVLLVSGACEAGRYGQRG